MAYNVCITQIKLPLVLSNIKRLNLNAITKSYLKIRVNYQLICLLCGLGHSVNFGSNQNLKKRNAYSGN